MLSSCPTVNSAFLKISVLLLLNVGVFPKFSYLKGYEVLAVGAYVLLRVSLDYKYYVFDISHLMM